MAADADRADELARSSALDGSRRAPRSLPPSARTAGPIASDFDATPGRAARRLRRPWTTASRRSTALPRCSASTRPTPALLWLAAAERPRRHRRPGLRAAAWRGRHGSSDGGARARTGRRPHRDAPRRSRGSAPIRTCADTGCSNCPTPSRGWSRQLRVPDTVATVLAGGVPSDPLVIRVRTNLIPLILPGSLDDRAGHRARRPAGVDPLGRGHVRDVDGGRAHSTHLGLHSLAVDLRRHQPDTSLSDLVAAARARCGVARLGPRRDRLRSGHRVQRAQRVRDPRAGRRAGRRRELQTVESRRGCRASRSPSRPGRCRSRTARARGRPASATSWTRTPSCARRCSGLRLSAEDIAEASRYARVLATARGEEVGAASCARRRAASAVRAARTPTA